MVQYFPVVTGSLTVNGNLSVSGNVAVTGSLSGTSSLAANSQLLSGTGSVGFTTTGSFTAASSSLSSRTTQIESVYATTGSNSFRANQSITGSLTVTGQIIAQTINVQQVTSSIVYSSGSNTFGCDINSRQTFTGSFYQTGSISTFNSCVTIGSACAPVYSLDVYNRTGNVAMRLFQPTADTSYYNSMYLNGNHTCVIAYMGTAGSTVPNASLQNAFYLGTQNAYPLKFTTLDATRLTITSDGTVGVGVTPCAQASGPLAGSTEIGGIVRVQGASGRYFTTGDGLEISKSSIYSYNRGTSAYNTITLNDALAIYGAGITCFAYTICLPKIGFIGYNGITAHDLVGHFDAGSTNIATLSGENAYTRVAAHIEWVSNYALAGTNMTMGYTIVDTRRGNSNTIWVNCACTILAYGDSPANPTFGWSGGVLSVSVPGSTGLSARFRITTYAATLTPNI